MPRTPHHPPSTPTQEKPLGPHTPLCPGTHAHLCTHAHRRPDPSHSRAHRGVHRARHTHMHVLSSTHSPQTGSPPTPCLSPHPRPHVLTRGHHMVRLVFPRDHRVSLALHTVHTRAETRERAALPPPLRVVLPPLPTCPVCPLIPILCFQNMTLTCVFWDVTKGRAWWTFSG